MPDTIRIRGLPELDRKLTPALASGPARRLLHRWTIWTQSRAREKTPVDRGGARNSVATEIDASSGIPRWGRVGSNLHYFPAIEGGTGLRSDLPGGSKRRHFPPPDALEAWARRHGFGPGGGFLVARSIARRGGLTPKRPLRNAAEASKGQIDGYIRQMAREIEANASRGGV